MRAYGVPRDLDIEFPDIGDIKHYGLASHVGVFPTKSGEYRGYCRGASKAHARRLLKKAARRAARREIMDA